MNNELHPLAQIALILLSVVIVTVLVVVGLTGMVQGKIMTHIEKRLQERDIKVSKAVIIGLCYEYDNAAVILARQSHYGENSGDYYGRKQSNGDMVVLIIREHKPVTIMYRRSNQTNTAKALRVNQLVDITA